MKGEFEILALASPLRREIEARLRSAIVQGRFRVGERLVERQLCEMFGVSRPSLREALRQLEAEELVTLVPNRGPAVADVTPKEAHEIYELRATMEGLAARLFVRHASDADIVELRNAFRELRKAASANSSERLLDLKTRYYDILLSRCGNRILRRELTQLHNRIRLLRATTLAARTKAAIAEIAKIVDAVEDRDEESACLASMQHIERAAVWAISSLGERDDESTTKSGPKKAPPE
jgi:DNA-binding GntR family transcriptional regulator